MTEYEMYDEESSDIVEDSDVNLALSNPDSKVKLLVYWVDNRDKMASDVESFLGNEIDQDIKEGIKICFAFNPDNQEHLNIIAEMERMAQLPILASFENRISRIAYLIANLEEVLFNMGDA